MFMRYSKGQVSTDALGIFTVLISRRTRHLKTLVTFLKLEGYTFGAKWPPSLLSLVSVVHQNPSRVLPSWAPVRGSL